MRKIVGIACILFALYSCTIDNERKTESKRGLLNQWNQLTAKSLEQKEKHEVDDSLRSFYSMKREAFFNFSGLKDSFEVQKSSPRFLFLNVDESALMENSELTILEQILIGEKVSFINYILVMKGKKLTILKYKLEGQEWKRQGKYRIDHLNCFDSLSKNYSQFGKGINYEDLIISKFRSGIPLESEYFVSGSLSEASCYNIILSQFEEH